MKTERTVRDVLGDMEDPLRRSANLARALCDLTTEQKDTVDNDVVGEIAGIIEDCIAALNARFVEAHRMLVTAERKAEDR